MLTASQVVCQRCPLAFCGRKSIVDGSGPIPAYLMCVAEAPGEHEDKTGTPLVGESGKLLRSTIAEVAASLHLYDTYREGKHQQLPIFYTNTARCRPPENRKPTNKELDACMMWLVEEIENVQPRIILCLGQSAKEYVRKALAEIYPMPTDEAGFIAWQEHIESMLVDTWHPAYILRRHSKLDEFREAIDKAVRLAFQIPLISTCSGTAEIVEQWQWGWPDPNARYLSADTEYDDLEEHIDGRTKMAGWSVSDGQRAIFTTDPPRKFKHIFLHHADSDLYNLDVDPDDLDSYDDTILEAYPLQQRYQWPYLALKRPDGKGLAQTIVQPPVVWRHMLKSDLLKVYIPSNAVFKSGPRKGQEKPGKWKKKVQFSEVLQARPKDAGDYGATDSFGTSKLAETLDHLLDENPWARDYYYRIEKPLIPVLLQMETTGVKIDLDRLNETGKVIDDLRAETEFKLRQVPEFSSINIASDQQLGPVLLSMGLIDGKRTETGQLGVAEKNILHSFGVESDLELPQSHEADIVRNLLQWRHMGKLRSTYVDAIKSRLDSSSRIHPRLNSTGAYTNRLSSSDPNEQNIPSRTQIGMAIRRAFVAERGNSLVGGDLSQFQLRIFGRYTHAPIFVDAYTGGPLRGCPIDCKCPICDIHQRFTDLVNSWGFHVERASHTGGPSMKNGVFATLYGVAGRKLANTIGIPESEAGRFLTSMKKEVPDIVTWPEIASQELASQGYVETLLGWRMYFPDYGSVVNKWHNEAIREAACGKVQGTEGGLVKLAMRKVYENLKKYFPAYRMMLAVHDEIWTEGPSEQAQEVKHMIKETVESTMQPWLQDIPVIFDAKVIQSWDQGK